MTPMPEPTNHELNVFGAGLMGYEAKTLDLWRYEHKGPMIVAFWESNLPQSGIGALLYDGYRAGMTTELWNPVENLGQAWNCAKVIGQRSLHDDAIGETFAAIRYQSGQELVCALSPAVPGLDNKAAARALMLAAWEANGGVA